MSISSHSRIAQSFRNLRGQRLSQEIFNQIDLSQCVMGLAHIHRIGILILGLVLTSLFAALVGGVVTKIVMDLAFNYEGWRYVTIAFLAIIISTIGYWVQSYQTQSIWVVIISSWIGLPVLIVGLCLIGLVPLSELIPSIVVGFFAATVFIVVTLVSTVGISFVFSLIQMSWHRHVRWLCGCLSIFFILLCIITAVALSISGGFDNPTLQQVRQEKAWVTPVTQGLCGLAGGAFAMVIVRTGWKFLSVSGRWDGYRHGIVRWARALANLRSTSFRNLDLSHVSLAGLSLANVDLRARSLYRTQFLNTTGWFAATVDTLYLDLDQPKVQALLAGHPICKDFRRVNLRGVYLRGALEEFDFTEAILDGADLQGVNLRYSCFVRSLVTDVDFSYADLTGCCLKDWSFNRYTRFEHVTCDYIYRDIDPDTGAPSDRYPKERNFEPGEFEAVVRKLESSYELVFDQGLDPISLSFVFEKFRLEDEGLGLELQGLEQRGDLWIVKVGHSEGVSRKQVADHVNTTYDDLRTLFETRYQLALEAKEGEIARLSSYYQVLMEIQQKFLEKLGDRSGENNQINYYIQRGEFMSNQNINAGGNVDASTGAKVSAGGDIVNPGTLNLGSISGQVSNLVQQLKDSPVHNAPTLADLLTELQTAIQEEPTLPDDQKQEALEAVGTLAEEAKKTPENRITKLCTLSLNALKGIASSISDVSKLAEIVKTSLPLLVKLLGLP